ncbi:MAG: bifunctional (p)ppGpp synthetase/guanosine-3',5'-bis(diphosphate) 3'-pyrophosphohydrolase, partial [Proteobacteria bacterium]|nr:bifunctional (p)ppGpp synthetase/guanosine-3',5'-bis(diphosphate) 3'-pyrophosphohydrolase [Pseudomonadota bacterium]
EQIVPRDEIEKQRLKESDGSEQKEKEESFLRKVFNAAKRRSDTRNAITVANLDDVLIRFGRCCNPLPGDSIIGFITRGRGVTIHTGTCPKAIDNDQDRRVDVRWNLAENKNIKRHVRIRILSLDAPGLLAMMSQTITGCGVNIASANIRTTKDKKAIALFEVEVGNMEQLNRVMSALESKKGVISVERS